MEVLPIVYECAEMALKIIGTIKAGGDFFGGFHKKPNIETQKVLQALAQSEHDILDAIHEETLRGHLLKIKAASEWWNEQGLRQILDEGITYDNIAPNGALHATEEFMIAYSKDLRESLLYFRDNPLPTSPAILNIILGAHTLQMTIETIFNAIYYIRKQKSVPLDMGTINDLAKNGEAATNRWADSYKVKRRSDITLKAHKELAGDESHPHPHYEWSYSIGTDRGGDEIIPKFAERAVGTYNREDETQAQMSLMKIVAGAWTSSEKGYKAVQIVLHQWNSVQTSSG